MKHIMFITTIWALMLPTIFTLHIEDCGKIERICYYKKKKKGCLLSVQKMCTPLPIIVPVMEKIEFVLLGHSFFSGSKVGSFTNITISSCEATDPVCILKRNSNATLDIYFTTSKGSYYDHSIFHVTLLHISFFTAEFVRNKLCKLHSTVLIVAVQCRKVDFFLNI